MSITRLRHGKCEKEIIINGTVLFISSNQFKGNRTVPFIFFSTTPYFSDVPSTHTFFKYVQKLKDEGITAVTETYGVDNIVTRAQMAAFLARAFLGME